MPRFCCVNGCPGDTGTSWQKSTPLSFFRVPAIISESNKRFCGFGQEERKRKIIQLSRKRRRAWLNILKKENVPDAKTIKICARHFISGLPADLEDENNPDWVPSLNLGYETSTTGKTKSAVKRHKQQQLIEKRNEAVKFYGGSSDVPVFVETEGIEEVLVLKTDDESSLEEAVTNLESSFQAVQNSGENGEVSVDVAAGEGNHNKPTDPNEKYGHWHVHFCTKRACLFSKAAAKCYSVDTPDEDDE